MRHAISETQFAPIGDITLHYRHDGLSDGPPLLFVNSLGTDLRVWDQLTAAFAENFSIVRYDKRGHGLSDCLPGPYSIRDFTNDLAGLLDYLNIEAALLIGISVGGMIALDFAAHHPQRVKALVLCDTAARIGTPAMWNERIETLQQHGMDYLGQTIVSRWFAPGFLEQHPLAHRGYYNMLVRTPVAGYIATCAAIRDADLRASLGTVTAKALVLCGADDVATPPDQVRELAAMLPDARFELIENAAHLPCIEQPDIMTTKIKQFFQEQSYG
jgi:3-oxoadipate enol-lactonase